MDVGNARFFRNRTYHHAVLRALNAVGTRGADVSEVLEAVTGIRAGDEEGWFTQWRALADRNVRRAEATTNARSRGEALLRAHTYYARAQFFLHPTDGRRAAADALCRSMFYEGLDTLGVEYAALDVPYGHHTLRAVFYPAPQRSHESLIVFHGGYDTIKEELYFFLAAEATARGYDVLTFDGPGQGEPLRAQGLRFTHEWEKPVAAVLDTFLPMAHPPSSIVLVGLSMGGYLAPRAAAFEPRVDGVVCYGVMFDMHDVIAGSAPSFIHTLRRRGRDDVVDRLAWVAAKADSGIRWGLRNAKWTLGASGLSAVLDATTPYTLAGVAERIGQDVLILSGGDDHMIPAGQLERLQAALVNARSVTSHVYDRATGGKNHSQLGAPTLWQADFFDWMFDRFD